MPALTANAVSSDVDSSTLHHTTGRSSAVKAMKYLPIGEEPDVGYALSIGNSKVDPCRVIGTF